MPISAAELLGIVTIRGADEGALKLLAVGGAADSAGAKLAGLAVGGTVLAGAALVGIGVAATRMAADFQQGVNRLKTGGGDVQDSFKSLWTGIQKVADATGVLTGPLTDSMYLIVSAGQRGAQAFKTITAAAQGAQIEQAKVADVTQILTTVQTNFGLTTHTAAQYMDALVSAVSHGKITLEDLSTAMSPILPLAASMHVHFQDVAAAMSDMTNMGLPAAQAATGLRDVFTSIEKPTKAATKAMQEYGVNSEQVAKVMQTSLPDAFQILIDAAKKAGTEGSQPFIDALSSMVGGGQRTAKVIAALDQSMGNWRSTIKDVNAAMGDTSKNVAGWDTAQSNLNVKLQEGLANLQTLGQNIGMVILPYVSSLLDRVTPLIGRFQDWFVNSGRLNTVLQTLGTVLSTTGHVLGTVIGAFTDAGAKGDILRGALVALGTVFAEIKILQFAQGVAGTIMFLKDLIPAVWGSTVAFGALDVALGPLALVIGAIGIAVAGATYAFTHWNDIIKQNDQQVGTYLKDYQHTSQGINTQTEGIGGFFDRLGAGVKSTFESMHIGTLGSLSAMVSDTQQKSQQMSTNVTTSLSGMVSGAQGQMSQFGGWMANQWGTMQRTSLTMSSTLSDGAIKNFDKLKGSALGDMSQLDDSAKGYWNDVANYIENNPITGSVTYTTAPIAGSTGQASHHFASGTSYAPGGWSWTGERGPELMYVPRGAQIIPHTQSVGSGSPGGAGGSPVQVNINIAGHNVARVLLPELVQGIRQATGAKF